MSLPQMQERFLGIPAILVTSRDGACGKSSYSCSLGIAETLDSL